jgi:hypothetical protein
MLTTFNEVDMNAIMALRNGYKEAFEKKHGVKVIFEGTRSLVNLEKMQKNKDKQYLSVVQMDDPVMILAVKEGLLEKLTVAQVPNLANLRADAEHMRDFGPKDADVVGRAVLAALDAAKGASEASCKAFLACLRPALDEARKLLAEHGNKRQQRVSQGFLGAFQRASALDWSGPTTKQIVTITRSFDRVTLSAAGASAPVRASRAGPTGGQLVVPVDVSGDARAYLAAALPLVFMSGQAEAGTTIEFLGWRGVAEAAVPSRRIAGRVELKLPPEAKPGPVTGFDFGLEPPGPIPTGAWWKVPGGNRSGKPWNIGVNSTGWNEATVARYQQEVGRPIDAFCAGAHRGGAAVGTWEEVAGGPLGSPGTIAQGSQLDWDGSTGFGQLLPTAVKGKTFCILNTIGVPSGGWTWKQLGVPGQHDEWWHVMGQRLRTAAAAAGLEPWQLVLRWHKEMNQGGQYQVRPGEQQDYAAAMARCIKAVRAGYGDTGQGRLRMTFSPARADDIGPLEGFCSFDADGSCLYDTVSCSTHPANQLNGLVGKPYEQQKDAVRKWLAGAYKPGYSYLNADPSRSALAFARKYGLPISLDEWSPRFEPDLYCGIAAAAFEVIHEMLAEHAAEVAWDCVFDANVLDEQDIVPGWAEASRTYKRLWGKGA